MRLTVIGCAGSYPSAQSPASCYLVEHDGHRIVLDMGNGALGALQRHVDLTASDSLDAVLLSHCHIDHCADVGSLHVFRRHHPNVDFARLPILAPSDAIDRLAAIYGMADPAELLTVFDVRTLGAQPETVGPFEIRTVRTAHPVETYAIRVDAGGSSLTYSADTGPTEALAELARGSDVALFEASFVGDRNPPDLHMTGADAARSAQAAGAGLLLLTHLVAWNDDERVLAEAVGHFDGAIELARPGMTITV
jgi:ribonuclease BN (tRNA processing enzyme)